jgi:hypothetical protein
LLQLPLAVLPTRAPPARLGGGVDLGSDQPVHAFDMFGLLAPVVHADAFQERADAWLGSH